MMRTGKEKPMSGKILVAFATVSGSTQEIAEAVVQQLREAGLEVDIQPARSVKSLAGYRAVVLGAPLYMFHWHRDALSFLSRQRDALTKLPVAVFALGPWNDVEKDWQDVRGQIDKELAKFPWLSPVSLGVFGGKFDPAKLRFPYNLIPGLKKMPTKDIRDWVAIRAWADDLAAKF
jgi:menaquinone-dependent protoporphyrinogen oxidase